MSEKSLSSLSYVEKRVDDRRKHAGPPGVGEVGANETNDTPSLGERRNEYQKELLER